MNRGRIFAHIYEINSLEVKAYLLPGTNSLIQGHYFGVSKIARIGSFVLIDSAGIKLVGVINSLHVTEPEKLYWLTTTPDFSDKQFIRTISILLIGQFYNEGNNYYFERGINNYPSLDEEVLIPTQEELNLILNEKVSNKNKLIEIGRAYSTDDIKVKIDPVKLFSRHCAIVGSTGNGKSCTVTVLLNEILNKKISLPIFIFDINGEYSWAFENMDDIKIIKFAGKLDLKFKRGNKKIIEDAKVNYASFSRRTWRTMLKPSDRTQIPALNFAIDILKYLRVSYENIQMPEKHQINIPTPLRNNPKKPIWQYLCGDPSESDPTKLLESYQTLQFLKVISSQNIKTISENEISIPMHFLAKAITDRWAIQIKNNNYIMDSFRYQHVGSLCDRITELYRDPLFNSICDVKGNQGLLLNETTKVKETEGEDNRYYKIIIFDLSLVPQEYLPIMVDCLLEQHLSDALQNKFKEQPHLLVLDEAHHYLGRRYNSENENEYLGNSPGERIAKEGRKFGLHMLVSTQRPGELSPTIVAQIGTIISHALTNDKDRDIVNAFGSYNDRTILNELSILPRREAIIIGQAVSMPSRVKISFLSDEKRPKSKDPLEDKI